MTTGDPTGRVSEAEVLAFAQKLEAWGKELPPREAALLELMVQRAMAAPEGDATAFGRFELQQGIFSALGPVLRTGSGLVAAWADTWDPEKP